MTQANRPRSPLASTIRWLCALISLTIAGFSAAWMGVLLAANWELWTSDAHYWRALPPILVGTAFGLFTLRRTWKCALAVFAGLILCSVILIEVGRGSGSIGNQQDVIADVLPKATELSRKLEAAHAKGVNPNGWTDLVRSGVIRSPDEFDTHYYSSADYTWRAEFDVTGRMIGEVHLQGDGNRNVPSSSVNFKDQNEATIQLWQYIEILPSFPRE